MPVIPRIGVGFIRVQTKTSTNALLMGVAIASQHFPITVTLLPA
jgi:hypothetical protein